MKKTYEYKTFDELPNGRLKKGDHVRSYTSKLRKKFSGPVGEIRNFVTVRDKWRAFVTWTPEEGEAYEQFVDADLLGVVMDPIPVPKYKPEPEPEQSVDENDLIEVRVRLSEKWIADHKLKVDPAELGVLLKQYGHELFRVAAIPRFCPDCAGLLKFDPNVVGDTVGGLTLRGWDMCTAAGCGKGWISDRAVPDSGKWKLTAGGRSIDMGDARLRADAGPTFDVAALMARIVKLPELELEVAKLRDYKTEQEALVKESETITGNEFRLLQQRVYSAMTTIAQRSNSRIEGTTEDVKTWISMLIIDPEFEIVDRNELTCAIQYAIKYGRMP